jgi:phage terminase large subunit-like protein
MAHPHSRLGIVARTLEDGRDVCVEGESGLLSVLPVSELRGGSQDRAWNRSLGELFLANGTKYELYSSKNPDALRGPQFHRLWFDELASWIYLTKTWDMAMFGLRLGQDPRVVITTTPKPLRLIRELLGRPDVVVTRGTTYENRMNLAPTFYSHIIGKYEGTRLGRQELRGEILEDAPGALWTRDGIEADRAVTVPDLDRVVVGVDPAVTSRATSAETGIVTVGAIWRRCPCGHLPNLPHAFVLADNSLRGTPGEWGKAVVRAYSMHHADRVIGEVNNGGDLVEANVRSVDPNVSYSPVNASRGKKKRAEPVAALYEQHRVHHVGAFPDLEDQMVLWEGEPEDEKDGTEEETDFESPDHMDALVWALTELLVSEEPAASWLKSAAPACPHCQRPNLAGSRVCRWCGKPIEPAGARNPGAVDG